jgi:hypothetical protein
MKQPDIIRPILTAKSENERRFQKIERFFELTGGFSASPRRGRPIDRRTALIYQFWIKLSKPNPIKAVTCDAIAARLLPEEFKLSERNSQKRKKLRDLIRSSVKRSIAATKK